MRLPQGIGRLPAILRGGIAGRIRIARKLESMQAKMLLQVHDELVFEGPPEELPAISELVKREMEGACDLKVPLLVDIGVGDNWRDAK